MGIVVAMVPGQLARQSISNLRLFVDVINRKFPDACRAGCRTCASKTRTSLRSRMLRGFTGGHALSPATVAVYQKGIPAEYAPGGKAVRAYPGAKKGWYRSGELAESLTITNASTGRKAGGVIACYHAGPSRTAVSSKGVPMIDLAYSLEYGYSRKVRIPGKTRAYIAKLLGHDVDMEKAKFAKAKVVQITYPGRPLFQATWEKTVEPRAADWFMKPFSKRILNHLAKGSVTKGWSRPGRSGGSVAFDSRHATLDASTE